MYLPKNFTWDVCSILKGEKDIQYILLLYFYFITFQYIGAAK